MLVTVGDTSVARVRTVSPFSNVVLRTSRVLNALNASALCAILVFVAGNLQSRVSAINCRLRPAVIGVVVAAGDALFSA